QRSAVAPVASLVQKQLQPVGRHGPPFPCLLQGEQWSAGGGGQARGGILHTLRLQPGLCFGGGRHRQRQAPAARYQRRQRAVGRLSRQQEHGVFRGFFEDLQQGIGRDGIQGFGRVQQRDAPATSVRGGVEPGQQTADLLD